MSRDHSTSPRAARYRSASTSSASLSAFDSVWDALIPSEQARVLGLLTERITYDVTDRNA